MSDNYYVGFYQKDSANEPNHGWIVGTFKEDPVRKTDDLEIKYWEFDVGLTNHQDKESSIIECTFILSGKTKGFIDNKEVVLQAGHYVVIKPGIPNNLVAEILEPTRGLTIKAPSDPTAKRII